MSNKNTMSKVTFMSVDAFKRAIGVDSIDIFVNEEKLNAQGKHPVSVCDTDGVFYRAAANFDISKPHAFLLEEGKKLEDACLVNVTSKLRKIGTL